MNHAIPPYLEADSSSARLKSWSGIDAIAIGVKATEAGPQALGNAVTKSVIDHFGVNLSTEISLWPDFTGKAGEIIELPVGAEDGVERLYLVGVGSESRDDLRKAGAALGRKTKGSGFSVLDGLVEKSEGAKAHAIALALSQYQLTFKATKKSDLKKPTTFILFGDFEKEVEAATVNVEAIYRARDLIHTPSNIKTPAWIAAQAKAFAAKTSDISVTVLSGRQLAKFGGLQAVGGSSPNPGPRMIQVSYSPKGSSKWPHVVLVGKGITFDTGGISLKRPYDIMIGMKSDMAGAAAVLTTVMAMPAIKPKVRVTALLMCAENAIGATAQRPSDVITQYDGTTVEVLDTDAEGRLVLADGLAYARLELDPDYIIDVATLTGAATLGLGRQYAAMYTRNQKLAKQLSEAGLKSGDRVWHMPLIDDYAPGLESDYADISNLASKGHFGAGSITAALFLEHFVADSQWVHLDIAGTGRSEVDAGEFVKGGTGFGPRLLIEWITSL